MKEEKKIQFLGFHFTDSRKTEIHRQLAGRPPRCPRLGAQNVPNCALRAGSPRRFRTQGTDLGRVLPGGVLCFLRFALHQAAKRARPGAQTVVRTLRKAETRHRGTKLAGAAVGREAGRRESQAM